MIKIKREFNNGLFDCLEIYSDIHKVKEMPNGIFWNTSEEEPIVIVKSRLNDYTDSIEDKEQPAKEKQ